MAWIAICDNCEQLRPARGPSGGRLPNRYCHRCRSRKRRKAKTEEE